MLPLAPPAFSMTTVCPSGCRMRSAMMRAVVSVEPPGGNGTMSVIGRVGKFWACAAVTNSASAAETISLVMDPSREMQGLTIARIPARMLIDFFLKLKSHKLPVSIKEYLTLLEAMRKDVISPSIDDFYYLARTVLVKDE